ncbi:hypothetical protein [Arthrobacter sp. JSM 101049]|uniref:hypothetical protein n=1 Tax=Arthrobacter sp. JSM 101049 TaxID=929097 RepID=UPI00356B5F00
MNGAPVGYRFGDGMRWVTWLFISTGVLWAVAIVLWLAAGGRAEFTTGTAPWSWHVLVPAWITLAGIVLALGGCVVFAQQMVGAILGRFEHSGFLDPPAGRAPRERPRK